MPHTLDLTDSQMTMARNWVAGWGSAVADSTFHTHCDGDHPLDSILRHGPRTDDDYMRWAGYQLGRLEYHKGRHPELRSEFSLKSDLANTNAVPLSRVLAHATE